MESERLPPAGSLAGSSVLSGDVHAHYLDLLKLVLTGEWLQDRYRFLRRPNDPLFAAVFDALRAQGIELVTQETTRHDLYEEGGGWPAMGDTMIGRKRLDNLHACVETVLVDEVPGDLIETGVWRGGATILMRAILAVHGVEDRRVWVADSFEGVPPPDPDRSPADAGDRLHTQPVLAVSLEEVRANFARYGLLDENVRFVQGWFKDTLPALADVPWAVIRLDGDLYESTMDGLMNLYPGLSPGGFLIVDDYGAMPPCNEAVHDYRSEHGIDEPIETIDWTGIFWRKQAPDGLRG